MIYVNTDLPNDCNKLMSIIVRRQETHQRLVRGDDAEPPGRRVYREDNSDQDPRSRLAREITGMWEGREQRTFTKQCDDRAQRTDAEQHNDCEPRDRLLRELAGMHKGGR